MNTYRDMLEAQQRAVEKKQSRDDITAFVLRGGAYLMTGLSVIYFGYLGYQFSFANEPVVLPPTSFDAWIAMSIDCAALPAIALALHMSAGHFELRKFLSELQLDIVAAVYGALNDYFSEELDEYRKARSLFRLGPEIQRVSETTSRRHQEVRDAVTQALEMLDSFGGLKGMKRDLQLGITTARIAEEVLEYLDELPDGRKTEGLRDRLLEVLSRLDGANRIASFPTSSEVSEAAE